MSIRIFCVSPIVFEGFENNYLIKNFLNFSKNDKKRYEVTSEQRDFEKKSNRYNVMSEDSFLEKDQFIEVRFNFNNDSYANLLVSKSNMIVLEAIYDVNGEVDFDSIQKEVSTFINDIIIKIRKDCGLISDINKLYFKWINRTLECSKDFVNANEKRIMTQWLFCEEPIINKLCTYKYYLSWGNNIVCNEIEGTLLKNVLDSIVIMQYYYTLLDSANNELREMLNTINFNGQNESNQRKGRAKKEFEHTKTKLNEMKNMVNSTIIKFNDDVISLQSYKKYFSEKIMVIWEFDKLLNSIEKKLDLCEDILLDLENKIMKRSIFITDLILFFIGLSGVLSFTLYLGEFLDNQANQEINGFNNIFVNIPNVMTKFLTNSFTGVLNLVSLLMLFLLLISYINYKRK